MRRTSLKLSQWWWTKRLSGVVIPQREALLFPSATQPTGPYDRSERGASFQE